MPASEHLKQSPARSNYASVITQRVEARASLDTTTEQLDAILDELDQIKNESEVRLVVMDR